MLSYVYLHSKYINMDETVHRYAVRGGKDREREKEI